MEADRGPSGKNGTYNEVGGIPGKALFVDDIAGEMMRVVSLARLLPLDLPLRSFMISRFCMVVDGKLIAISGYWLCLVEHTS